MVEFVKNFIDLLFGDMISNFDAIIFVMGVLIGITTLLNKFFSRKKNDKDDE
ncbi:MAG: hypothetical protein IKW34_02445 [Clostridia bacterium]|nr:hypothetical protein [Clostridia bacterium]